MKTPLGTEVDLHAGHIVLGGFPALCERGTAPLPLLGPCLLWPRSPISATAELFVLLPNGWMDQDVTWYGGRPRPRPHCGRWGPSSASPKGGTGTHQFLAHVYCAQTAGWVKMPLSIEVRLEPSNIVLDGDPAPLPKKGGIAPSFSPYLLWPNSCMDQDATWYGGRPRPRPHCARWGPSSLSPKRMHRPLNFRPMFVVAKRLDGSRCDLVWKYASTQATLC